MPALRPFSPSMAPFSSLGVQAASLHEGFLYVFSNSSTLPPVILDILNRRSRVFAFLPLPKVGEGRGEGAWMSERLRRRRKKAPLRSHLDRLFIRENGDVPDLEHPFASIHPKGLPDIAGS